MATITGLTAARMLAIEAASIVSGAISGDNLILTKFDGSTVNAGNVRGPQGPTGPDGNPIGTFIMGGWASEPANYKFLNGQTITDGAITYATIAALFPSWVSGNNLILPNAMNGVVPMGSSTAGAVSGSMTHTLTEANLANHIHTVSAHTHTGPSHTHTGPSHQHSYSGWTENASPTHTHAAGGGNGEFIFRDTAYNTGFAIPWNTSQTGGVSPIAVAYVATTTNNSTTHSHYMTGTTDASGTGVTGSSGTGATGSGGGGNTSAVGSGTPVDHTPRNITVKLAVKVL